MEKRRKTWLLLGVAMVVWASCEDPSTTELREIEREVVVYEGTAIRSAEDLAKIGRSEDFPAEGQYYLAADIDLKEYLAHEGVLRAIGSTCKECGGPLTAGAEHALPLSCFNGECSLYEAEQEPFSGVFYGNGKKISGLVLSGGTTEQGYAGAVYVGLFGYIDRARIRDLTLELGNTEAEKLTYTGTEEAAVQLIGGLAAFARDSHISGVEVRGTGLHIARSREIIAGGVAGAAVHTVLGSLSSSLPLYTGHAPGTPDLLNQTLGGLVGRGTYFQVSGGRMSANIGVESKGGVNYIGGIAGYFSGVMHACEADFESLEIRNAYTGETSASQIYAGGIAGYVFPTYLTFQECSAVFDTLEVTLGGTYGGNVYVGGLVGNADFIEKSHASFQSITVRTEEGARFGSTYVGGLAGASDFNDGIRNSYIAGKDKTRGVQIEVNGSGGSVYVGGLTGWGAFPEAG